MVRVIFLFGFLFLSNTAWCAQGFLRVGGERLISDGLNRSSRCFLVAARFFSTTSQGNESSHSAEKVVEPSVLSQSPRILTCHRVEQTKRGIPTYASELSQMILERRLGQLPPGIDRNLFKGMLKERFDYNGIWLSTTSNAVFDHENYRVVVNHTGADTLGRYYSEFDVFLRETPQKLWIEGEMTTSDIEFEGPSIRDASGLSYSFEVLLDEVFPNGLLKAHFSGKKLSDTKKKNPKLQHLIEGVLNKDVLNQMVFWRIGFIPFINSSSHHK